ncbi:hypothetical protein EJ05DRAFT_482492 [Pseudovirgaria hyperparasitica]|uniref:Vegetative cell wall protein gp1 n=1 Tax=Pseudovirgaria hyperparasitica TaxID=470096 RepID=A0A6A6WHD9_9PEZI|nr:uncharacterized protein EJ05DRAFT_482492 [Pseudovirgaria hyperparasitica]KAF2761639.1 hypothetical protein EJ05DRAFT_482492 [Pseudovirgaria hyperparasitica]
MYATPQYPPGYTHYDYYRTPPVSPSPNPQYYSPRYSTHNASPSPRASPSVKGHSRRASHHDPPQYTAYASPRPSYYGRYASPQHQAYYASHNTTSRRESDYARRYTGTDAYPDRDARTSHYAGRTYVVFDDSDDYPYDHNSRTPPPPYEEYYHHYRYAQPADHSHRDQVPVYTGTDSVPQQPPRARRHSNNTTTRPTQPQPKSKHPPKPSHPAATEEDARRAQIPAGYNTKNWDPAEEPILLLGSVFDANSLGRWIYDWTAFVHPRASPLAEMAGDLWILLIKLAGNVKRAEEVSPLVRCKESREIVEDFLESGERLWTRFGKLLKVCEEYMWKPSKDGKSGRAEKPAVMGRDSGVEFVDSMFGRDRELERTEKLMTAMRLWDIRFEANCKDILKHPDL